MAHMQRAGRVGRDIFHAHRAAVAGQPAAVVVPLLDHMDHFALVGGRGEMEIDEARAGNLHARYIVAGRQCGQQCLGQRTRVAARSLGQQHRRIGGEIAVLAGLGPLDHKIRRQGVGGQGAIGAQGFDALADQCAELGFHVGSAWNETSDFTRPRGRGSE